MSTLVRDSPDISGPRQARPALVKGLDPKRAATQAVPARSRRPLFQHSLGVLRSVPVPVCAWHGIHRHVVCQLLLKNCPCACRVAWRARGQTLDSLGDHTGRTPSPGRDCALASCAGSRFILRWQLHSAVTDVARMLWAEAVAACFPAVRFNAINSPSCQELGCGQAGGRLLPVVALGGGVQPESVRDVLFFPPWAPISGVRL